VPPGFGNREVTSLQEPGEEMLARMQEPCEYTVPSRDGLRLKVRWWPTQRPRGIVIVAHGLGEHGGAYAHLAEVIGSPLDLDFIALDFRGHGRSPGRRGVVRRYDDLVGDLAAIVSWARNRRPDLPLFLLGHSNGGQVVLRLLLETGPDLAGVIASNPSIRIAMPVPPGKLKLGQVLRLLAPWVTLRSQAPSAWMTRDPVMREKFQGDTLRHDRVSAPLFFGMVEGGEMLLARAGEIKTPILLLLGGQDQVICPSSSREFYDRLGSDDKTLMVYPKMLHEPLNELGREQVFDDVARWLEPRLERA
jgi:alpha-beta hydrolase superfamily lysophospholipase